MIEVKPTTIEAPPIARIAPVAAPVGASLTKTPPLGSSGAPSGVAITATPAKQGAAASDTKPEGPKKEVTQAGEEESSAPMAPEIPPTAAPTVDPLVQAVREDIREDEARSK